MTKQIHSKEAALAVCRTLVANDDIKRALREDVRAILKQRAQEVGQPPVALSNKLIGQLLDQARAERRQERVAAAQATAAEVEIDLPLGLGDLLQGHTHAVEALCRKALADALQRARAEADARVAQVQTEAQGERSVLEAELAAVRSDRDSVAVELDETLETLAAERGRGFELSTDLMEKTSALAVLQGESREQVALLTQDLRLAQDARAGAEVRATTAERRVGELLATLARLEERHGALELDRDRHRDGSALLGTRATEAERNAAETRGRLAALEEECARLRNEAAKPHRRSDTAIPRSRAPQPKG